MEKKSQNFSDICSGCGICCKMVAHLQYFPEPIDENGACTHLKEDNSCSIYEDRPLICRVDDMYEVLKKHFKSKQEYIKLTVDTCNLMITEVGLDDEFLIK